MSRAEPSLVELRSRLERRANLARAKLLRTLAALDVRRHRVSDGRWLARRVAGPAAASLAGVAVVAVCAAAVARTLVLRHRRKSLAYRLGERVAPFRRAMMGDEPAPFASTAGRRLALGLVGAGAAELAKRIVREVFAARGPVAPSVRRLAEASGPSAPRLGVTVVDAPDGAQRRTTSYRPRRR